MIILVRGYLQNKEIIGDTWYPIASISTMKYFLLYYSTHKSRVCQLSSIIAFLQFNIKHRVFLKLYIRYKEYLPEYCSYFGRPLILKKSVYGMTNSGKIFSGELTNWLMCVAGFNQSPFQMSIYYKYAPYGSNPVVLSYVFYWVFW